MTRLPNPRLRADGRWDVQLDWGRKPNGQRIRKSIYGATEEECRAKLIEALASRERGESRLDEQTTLSVLLDDWLATAKIDLRPHTLRFYGDQARLHIKPVLGHKAVAKITPNDVQALVNAKNAEGLSPRMVRHIRSTLRAALNYAEEQRVIRRGTNPAAAKIRLPALDEDAKPNAMTPDQLRHALSFDDPLHALWVVTSYMGLRQAEALGLRWSDLTGDKLTISGQLQRVLTSANGSQVSTLGRVPYTKTRQSARTITLPTPVLAALQAHPRPKIESLEGFIFCTKVGTPLEPRNVIRSWHALLAKAGLPRFRFHDLRHTAITNMLRAGVDIKVVAQIVGHKDATMILRTYAHVQADHHEDAARKIEGLLA